jgi:hypothetical protein
LDEAAMKYEVFKQIIAPTKSASASNGGHRATSSPTARGKGKGRRPVAKPPPVVIPQEVSSSSFAKEAIKQNHPEFQKFIADLDQAFEPLNALLAEKTSDTALFLSSIRNAHMIPLECVAVFTGFATFYRDFSIMAAMNRKALSSDPPSFGNVN